MLLHRSQYQFFLSKPPRNNIFDWRYSETSLLWAKKEICLSSVYPSIHPSIDRIDQNELVKGTLILMHSRTMTQSKRIGDFCGFFPQWTLHTFVYCNATANIVNLDRFHQSDWRRSLWSRYCCGALRCVLWGSSSSTQLSINGDHWHDDIWKRNRNKNYNILLHLGRHRKLWSI